MPTIRPPARLEPRPGDEKLTIDQLRSISLFENLERPPDISQFPGAILLRHYRKGETICEQNQPGNTAFYLLTAQDLRELRQGQAGAPGNAPPALVRRWQEEAERL